LFATPLLHALQECLSVAWPFTVQALGTYEEASDFWSRANVEEGHHIASCDWQNSGGFGEHCPFDLFPGLYFEITFVGQQSLGVTDALSMTVVECHGIERLTAQVGGHRRDKSMVTMGRPITSEAVFPLLADHVSVVITFDCIQLIKQEAEEYLCLA